MKKTVKNLPDARTVALNVLANVWDNGAYANLALNMELNKYDLPDVERHFATELVYGAVKAGETLDLLAQKFISRPLKKVVPRILNVLRLGLFQIFFLERIPDSAAGNEAVKQARRLGHEGTVKFVNAVMRNAVRFKESTTGLASDVELFEAVKLQHPKWLIERWQKQLGEENTQLLCAINNEPASMCLRTNTLKITPADLEKVLQSENIEIEQSSWVAEGFVCQNNPSLAKLASFKQGLFQVQDESSMLVAHYLDVSPGQTVFDVCAAPGGKTTHIAALLAGEGKILACDIHTHKLEIIRQNADRLGIKIIDACLNDATVLNEEWLGKADRVLVDAPCSGLGVLRRRPDLRWRKQPDDLPIFPALQLKILQTSAQYLRSGGKIVYSTCTTEQAENLGVVDSFLSENAEFSLEKIKHPKTNEFVDFLQLWPHIDGTDGFFIAVLKKH